MSHERNPVNASLSLSETPQPVPLAIVGLGCRFPGGIVDANSFWELLINRRSGIREVPPNRWNWSKFYHTNRDALGSMITKWGGFLDDVFAFDASFFGISPREALRIDPQHRLLLETTWEALEDAGIPPGQLRGSQAGVFIGMSTNEYATLQQNAPELVDLYTNIGSAASIAANRISYTFDLKGPSLCIDTACSSALVAFNMACQSIWSGQSTMALVGGSNTLFSPNVSIGFSKAAMLSPNGQCFAFDHRGDGYVRSEGVGILVLKPLAQAQADHDAIYAIVQASAVNQDGQTTSMPVPGMAAQEAMLRTAYAQAGITPAHVAYIEAHGTGTPVGDPIEANALGHVLSENRSPEQPCLIGSVKSNIGHPEAASGIAGIIKALLIFEHELIPPNQNFEQPNPNIPFAELGLQVVTELAPLPRPNGHEPVIGVNSFGFGGTNAHVVLQKVAAQEPLSPESPVNQRAQRPYLLPLSARSGEALRAYAVAYATYLAETDANLADITYSAGARKTHHEQRLVLVGNDRAALQAQLRAYLHGTTNDPTLLSGTAEAEGEPIVFVFTGQGAQWWGMGRQLLDREPIFQATVARIDALLQPLSGWSLLTEMRRSQETSQIDRTDIAQPAIFALQVGLAELWRSWGVCPAAVVGHSVGEVAAAYVAGIYTLADAVKIIYHRSRLQNTTGGHGGMAAVGLPAVEAAARINGMQERVQISAINSPGLVTLAGDTEPLAAVLTELEAANVFVRRLPIDYAFHTHHMEPIQESLLAALADLQPRTASIPFISTVYAAQLTGTEMTADYWWHNVRQPVHFASAIDAILQMGTYAFLELGPHPALRSSLLACLAEAGQPSHVFHSISRPAAATEAAGPADEWDDSSELLQNLAQLHIHGIADGRRHAAPALSTLDWAAINQSSGRFVRLPGYPWQRETFWLQSEDGMRTLSDAVAHPLLGFAVSAPQPTWQQWLDVNRIEYLQDHRIWNNIIFPGSGYVEIGLAVAAARFPGEGYTIENLRIDKAFFLKPGETTTAQVIFEEEEKRFAVHSRTSERSAWELHAWGQLQKLTPPPAKTLDIDALQATLQATLEPGATHAAYYDYLAGLDYHYGPNFRLVQNSWREPGKALVEIIATDEIAAQVTEYHMHPALVDACIHAVAATYADMRASATGDLFLPVGVQRVHLLCDHLPAKLWVTATLNEQDYNFADLEIYDHEGKQVAALLGFQVERVAQADAVEQEIEGSFYQFRWEPRHLKGAGLELPTNFPQPTVIQQAVAAALPAIYAECDMALLYDEISPGSERLTKQIIQNAFIDLGWAPAVGEQFTLSTFMAALGVVESHERLVRTNLTALETAGVLHRIEQDTWLVSTKPQRVELMAELAAFAEAHPRFASDIALIRATGTNLADVLSGKKDAVEVLFPGGSAELLTEFYRNGGDGPATRRLMECVITTATAELPQRRPLRVLEVGAGTASLTSMLLPLLPADRTEYTFTDVSPKFLADAQKQFSDYPWIDYCTFDLDLPLTEQGIEIHGYDLVVASNVLHATADLRKTLATIAQCLASDGLLLFLELTDRHITYDNIFGLFEEWWYKADTDLRPDRALLERAEWVTLLRDCGYRDVQSFGHSPHPEQKKQSIFVAQAPTAATPAGDTADTTPAHTAATERYLLFADQQGTGSALQQALTARGAAVVTVMAGEQFNRQGAARFTVDPASKNDLVTLFAALAADALLPTTIIHGWSLDHPVVSSLNPTQAADLLSTAALTAAQTTGVFHALALTQVLDAAEIASPARLVFLTRNSVQVTEVEHPTGLTAVPLSGLLRVIRNERLDQRWIQIDLDLPQSAAGTGTTNHEQINDLLGELSADDSEVEIAYRRGQRYVNRLQRTTPEELPPRQQNAIQPDGTVLPYRLEIEKAGVLTDLRLNATTRRTLGPEEIEILVKAGGINFRDVMKALGIYPGNPIDLKWFGDDVAGVVVAVGEQVTDIQPGDRVAGLAAYGFRSYATLHQHLCFKLPDTIRFEEAATLPTVFLTAHYAINHLARMRRGERILIHAGTGGVGQAAIQIAHQLGLEIFATAGTPEKRDLLRELGAHHIFSSRTLDFADEILRITEGRGVDAVLNSLAGDFIPKNFSVLAPFGRYLEIGKIDVYKNSKIGLEPLRNNISVFVIDLGQHILEKPAYVAELFAELQEKFADGTYRPLPHTVFPITEVVEAFRYMAAGKHIGKNVLNFDHTTLAALPIGPNTSPGQRFRSDAAYLITGGTSGFGLEVAQWLAQEGAGHLVLMSRSGPPDDAARTLIAQLEADGVRVIDARGDVTQFADVKRVVQMAQESGTPLAGVIHAAVVYADGLLGEMDEERFKRTFYPKMLGAWNLHCATAGLPLEHFIAFSSLSSVYGSSMQANYNAGNAFLDALAHYRRAAGLPALTINWGSLGGAGFVARHAETAQFLENAGLPLFSMAAARRVLQKLTTCDAAQVGAGLVNWEQLTVINPSITKSNIYRHVLATKARGEGGGVALEEILNGPPDKRLAQVEKLLAQLVANVFGIDVARIRYQDSLAQGGLDSLMGIELLNSINSQFELSLSIGDLLSGSSIHDVATMILRNLPVVDGGEAIADASQAAPEATSSDSLVKSSTDRDGSSGQGMVYTNGHSRVNGSSAGKADATGNIDHEPPPQPSITTLPKPLPKPAASQSPTVAATAADVQWQQKKKWQPNGQNGTISMQKNGHATEPWLHSPLVPIRWTGSRAPFFCVHPWAGMVYPYFELAGLLGQDQPFYGLQAVGLYQQPHTTIEEMASHYLAALRRVQPTPPYRLGGWSIGGLIAFEIAQQIRRAGEEVALLAVFDEPAPIHSRGASWLAFTKFMVTEATRHIWPDVQAYLRLQTSLQQKERSAGKTTGADPVAMFAHPENDANTNRLQQHLQMSKTVVRELSALASSQSMSRRMYATLRATIQAQTLYQPQPYDGPLALFRVAQQSVPDDAGQTLGWEQLAERGVSVHHIPGHHLNIMRNPQVEILADQLQPYLAQVTPAEAERVEAHASHL